MNNSTAAAAACAALAVAMGIGRFAFTPVLPLMQAEGLSVPEGGWLAAANYLGYLLGALCAARLPLGSALVVRAGLVGVAAVTGAMAWDAGLWSWLAWRFIAGMLSAWVLVHTSSWALGRVSPAQGGIVFGGVGAGILLAGLLCLAAMGQGASAAQAWIALGLAAALLSACAIPVFSEAAVRRSASSAFPWTPDAMRLVACYGAYGFGYILPATFLPVMARQAVSDTGLFGWAWPVFGAAALLSTLAAARLRMDDRRLWAWSHLVMAAGVALPALVSGLGAVMVSAIAVGGTFMVVTLAAFRVARGSTVLVAAMTAAFAAGQLAGLLVIAGLGIDERGFAGPLLFAAALLGLSGFALFRRPLPVPSGGPA